jgi:hypothetical protein
MPVSIPSVTTTAQQTVELVCDNIFVPQIQVNADFSTGTISARALVLPYAVQNGAPVPAAQHESIGTVDLDKAATVIPELAAVKTAVLEGVVALWNYRQLRKADVTTAQQTLATANATLASATAAHDAAAHQVAVATAELDLAKVNNASADELATKQSALDEAKTTKQTTATDLQTATVAAQQAQVGLFQVHRLAEDPANGVA